MDKLRRATSKDLKNVVPEEDFKQINRMNKSECFVLKKDSPLKKKDEFLIELEIAFRKCKRVGVFD
jgi:hypothetical protein